MGGPGAQVGPAVVAKRLCDLLFQFPAAASVGVQWKTLARKYEERYGVRLDIASLGHTSAVTAAAALLWDVVRFISTENADNPIVAVEDTFALTPRPGAMASWPSLYKSLCEIVQKSGAAESGVGGLEDESDETGKRSLLLSKVKPLLQSQWHPSFEETSLGYLNEEGAFVKVKKMKHFVHAVLRWRNDRVDGRRSMGDKTNEVDAALFCELELVASKKHNDLVLQVSTPCPAKEEAFCAAEVAPCIHVPWPRQPSVVAAEEIEQAPCPQQQQVVAAAVVKPCCWADEVDQSDDEQVIEASTSLERELAQLRAENASLKVRNAQLQRPQHLESMAQMGQVQHPQVQPVQHVFASLYPAYFQPKAMVPARVVEVFDDPFEPPPQKQYSGAFSGRSTCVGSSSASEADSDSPSCGSRTNFADMDGRQVGENMCCSMMPMWFSVVPQMCCYSGDRQVIPSGIVGQSVEAIEAVVTPCHLPPVPSPHYIYMK